MKKTLLDYALYYVSQGFSVMPIRPKDKRPAIDTWKIYQEHKPTEDNLKIWFESSDSQFVLLTFSGRNLPVVCRVKIQALALFPTQYLEEVL